MKTIYKYQLMMADKQCIDMPVGAQVLCVQTQNGDPCIWAVVDDQAPKHPVTFFIRGTGHDLGEIATAFQVTYLGTFQLDQGTLVFHVWRLGRNDGKRGV